MPSRLNPICAASESVATQQRRVRAKVMVEDELRRRMFEEFREENAKDLEREALGVW